MKKGSFFLYLPHSLPHVPHFSSDRQAGKSEGGIYGDVIEDLDWSIGQLIAALEEMALMDNLLIFITSDNGGDDQGSVGPLRGRKQLTFEGGQKVPMIIYGKSYVQQPRTTSAIANNLDLFSTVLDLLKIAPPTDRLIDGERMLPMITGTANTLRQSIFYNAAISGNIVGVRDSTYKYHEGGNGVHVNMIGTFGPAKPLKPQLTNLALDNEAHNLIKKYPNRAEQLKAMMLGEQEKLDNNRRGWK